VPKLPRVNARELVRALLRAGFIEEEQEGSHLTLRHSASRRRVTIPMHPGDVGVRLTHKILKQAGISPDEFRELLR
jgi:predicted RNA binding protein YcfA (HicA-like mRNA interferase family)